jgi:hypothetical protein
VKFECRCVFLNERDVCPHSSNTQRDYQRELAQRVYPLIDAGDISGQPAHGSTSFLEGTLSDSTPEDAFVTRASSTLSSCFLKIPYSTTRHSGQGCSIFPSMRNTPPKRLTGIATGAEKVSHPGTAVHDAERERSSAADQISA